MKINKGNIIKNLRTERNLTQEEVGKIIGASKQTLHKYENGIITNIPQNKIEALANLFDVSPSYIMGWEKDKTDLSNIPGVIPVKKIIKIPILGHIQCGKPVMSVENYEGYFPADPEIINSDFCLYADGDSMIDVGINEGDLVFFKQTPQVENGTIAAVFVNDTTTLKRFYKKENQIILQPENKSYSPIIIREGDGQDVRVLGEMVGMYCKGSK
ncbi:helix-turn-helix domain-containing protein [Anaerococcus sp. AGMB00486]|uniref:Helix-turn-helix domain-containing protein n=1 Tax=Anaerococcus faecalis TaxID=2742993 RepID=A0ABX2NAW7_9FIRM|nr:XRE family transcriptional regulator [Anaerococcus faecalis]NVF11836.1 helix-turn-helix domain-containing protein [Anaerococcus faecalis]